MALFTSSSRRPAHSRALATATTGVDAGDRQRQLEEPSLAERLALELEAARLAERLETSDQGVDLGLVLDPEDEEEAARSTASESVGVPAAGGPSDAKPHSPPKAARTLSRMSMPRNPLDSARPWSSLALSLGRGQLGIAKCRHQVVVGQGEVGDRPKPPRSGRRERSGRGSGCPRAW